MSVDLTRRSVAILLLFSNTVTSRKLIFREEDFMGELDGFMRRIKKVDKLIELSFSVRSYHKDFILIVLKVIIVTITAIIY